MPGSLKTEAIVLRSIRYGEADRILHLYTPNHGRVGAIAKGARRSRSRFGARLEPFFQIKLVLHEGRGDLHTVTAVDTVDARPGLRDSAYALDAAARACDAVARLFETDDPHPDVFALLANELTLLASGPAAARPENALAFRLKLLLAAGIVPQLGSCANCGEREHLTGFSAAAGGRGVQLVRVRLVPAGGGRIRLPRRCARTATGERTARLAAGAAHRRTRDSRDRRAPRAGPTAAAFDGVRSAADAPQTCLTPTLEA